MITADKKLKLKKLKREFAEFIKNYPLGTSDLLNEIGRDVVGYEGLYQVSNFGRVKNFQRKTTRIIKPSLDSGGYIKATLSKDGKARNHNVHILVAKAFVSSLAQAEYCRKV